jgi:predicted Ser/Thr protein kinase
MVDSASTRDALTPTIVIQPGRKIAHFDLLSILGRGHFGEVWKARDTRLGREIAIKIPRGFSLDVESVKQFVREAKAISQLSHPNIVPIYDVGEDESNIYIVYKLIDGMTLDRFVKEQKPDNHKIVELLIKVCDALEHAHQRGIIHRDVKPSNILIDKADDPYLTDFGMASYSDASAEATVSGVLKGTVAYMSPEIAGGQIREADGRSDVYAMGVILYELLSGQRPFEGNMQQLLRQIVSEDPLPLDAVVRSIPHELNSITMKALEKSPQDRYRSCADLRDDLQRFLDGEKVEARSHTKLQRYSRNLMQHPPVSLFAGIAFVALGMFAIWGWLLRPAAAGPDQARPVSINTVPAGAQLAFFPLDPFTGRPQPEEAVRPAEKTPLTVNLKPADYLIVAVTDQEDYTFHEVLRHVPTVNDGLPEARFFHRDWKLEGATVVLPSINLPRKLVFTGMTEFEGAASSSGQTSTEDTEGQPVSPFYLDTREVTFGEYSANMGGIPIFMQNASLDQGDAVQYVQFDEALAYAEKLGKRLPLEAEFDFAATQGGTQKYPWGDDDSMIKDWPFGPPGIVKFDQTKSEPPVLGLYSNVGEWTMDYYVEGEKPSGIEPINRSRELRVVKGIAPNLLNPDSPFSKMIVDLYGTRGHFGGERQVGVARVGFRCARSKHPRLNAEDFSP